MLFLLVSCPLFAWNTDTVSGGSAAPLWWWRLELHFEYYRYYDFLERCGSKVPSGAQHTELSRVVLFNHHHPHPSFYENVFKCFTPKKILKWDSLFRSLLLSGEGELILWNNLEEKSAAIKYLDGCSCSTSRSWSSPISPEGSPASLSNSTHLIKTPSKALDRLLIKHSSQKAIWIECYLGPWWYISLNQF